MDLSTVTLFVKQVLATFITLIISVFPFAGNNSVDTFSAKDPDGLIMSFSAVSDIHVETNNPDSYKAFTGILKGLQAGENTDAVVFLGDNVMNGQLLESFFFYSALKGINPAEKNIVVAGNHDFGNGAGDYEALRKNYINNNKTYLGNHIDNAYFYEVINGCYMICLVSEDPTTQSFIMSSEQFDWLENVLIEAGNKNAPVIIFNHFPLRYLNGDKNADDLAELLNKYNVLLYIHGHIHNNLGTDNFYTWGGVSCINLPRSTEIVDYEPGDGIVVELYNDTVLVRGRDFINGNWIEDLEFNYQMS